MRIRIFISFFIFSFSSLAIGKNCNIGDSIEISSSIVKINSNNVLNIEMPFEWLEKKNNKKEEYLQNITVKINELCHIEAYTVIISTDYYKELWTINKSTIIYIDNLSSFDIKLGNRAGRTGDWFGSFNIRRIGGDYPANGFNIRLGRMLYKQQYDIGISYDYLKYSDAEEGAKSIGLSVRRYLSLTEHTGWNLGFKLDRNDYTGDWQTDLNFTTGLNFYLPGGSFDIVLNLGETGRKGISLGYTIYIGKKKL